MERMHGRHWGKAGAGLLLTTGRRALLCLRSGSVLQPYTWGIPGGAVHPSILGDPGAEERTARTEAEEEIGGAPPWAEVGRTVFADGAFRYTTIIGRVTEADATNFRPRLNWESDDARWLTELEILQLRRGGELHFGVVYTLKHAAGVVFPNLDGAVQRFWT